MAPCFVWYHHPSSVVVDCDSAHFTLHILSHDRNSALCQASLFLLGGSVSRLLHGISRVIRVINELTKSP